MASRSVTAMAIIIVLALTAVVAIAAAIHAAATDGYHRIPVR